LTEKSMDETTAQRILIVKLSAIGDVVHSLPFLEVLSANFPGARIDWLVEEEALPVIQGHPALNRVIVSRRKSWKKDLRRARGIPSVLKDVSALWRELRGCEYDWVIDLQGLLKSGILTGISKGKRKIGMDGAREGGGFFWNEPPVPVDYSQHAIDRYFQVADYLRCRPVPWEGRIPYSNADVENVDALLAKGPKPLQPVVAFNPMARWKTKLWKPFRFSELADRVAAELRASVVFTGSEKDRPVIQEIAGQMEAEPLNLAGKTTLKELACLYSRCRVLVTTDTGPMHIGAAMGCRVVALFGPTAPFRTGPYGEGHRVVRTEVDCSPCFKRACNEVICMTEITVDQVFQAVQDVLEEQGGL
jgi:3-deoxy-D-manno-octulosonic-acid transferase/heptosyltransferase-1